MRFLDWSFILQLMNIIFWNTNKKSINLKLKNLIMEKKCDIIALAEYNDDADELMNELYNSNISMKRAVVYSCDRVYMLYKEDIDIKIEDDNEYYVSYNVKKDGICFKLFLVHLPSKLWSSDGERSRIVIRAIKGSIQKSEKAVIVGDFNVNPFEDSIVSADFLSALPIVNNETRVIVGQEFINMYNPMWNLFGDFNGIPGTYYYNNASPRNYYWNMFDQVILSYSMKSYLRNDSLQIIDSIADTPLIRNGKIDNEISDHLPIFFEIMEGI